MLGAGIEATGSSGESSGSHRARAAAQHAVDARAALHARVIGLSSELGRALTQQLVALLARPELGGEALRDAVSTRLMEGFRSRASKGAFGLLYELNSSHLLVQVAAALRRFSCRSDPRDLLQEVFFNVYRYPHRFSAERDDAFRVWSAMIVRNTVLKHLRAHGRTGRGGRIEIPFEDLSEYSEPHAGSPDGSVMELEDKLRCGRVYVTYLHLYLRFYSMLSERERTAIRLVEIDESSYRDAARELGIRLENLKMVIFRARRKIHRAMSRVFEKQPAMLRPARAGYRTLPGLESSPGGLAPGQPPCKQWVNPVTGSPDSASNQKKSCSP